MPTLNGLRSKIDQLIASGLGEFTVVVNHEGYIYTIKDIKVEPKIIKINLSYKWETEDEG